MTKKSPLPPLDAELSAPRKRLNLKAIRQQAPADDETVSENSRTLSSEWQAATSLPSTQSPLPQQTPPRSPVASLRIEVPVYLDDALTQLAAAKRVTKQFLVLNALKQAGYHIEDVDLVADKRKARRKE